MKLNVGYNFSGDLPSKLDALNQKFGDENNAISSVYGSVLRHAWLSARPDFRLPAVPENMMASHIRRLSDYGIEFNYALNSINPGNSKSELMDRESEFINICRILQDMGVKRFIISNPILIEMLRRRAPDLDIQIELSTIMHVDTPMQILAYKQMDPRITRVVGNILYNRDFNKLKAFVNACEKTDMEYEVMVNEFCLTATGKMETPIAAHCVYRDSCYNCHAGNKSKDDALTLHNYPMGKCMTSRAFGAADWLRTFTCRPQDLHFYESIGIDHFKITGRTGTSEYIELMAEAYLSREWLGNYLELWKPLETIYNNKTEAEHKHKFNLPTDRMYGFFEAFSEAKIDCNMVLCENCRYCDRWADKLQGISE